MKTIVFKQSYKAGNAKSTRALNIKHLHYIATRPGTAYNKSCGFGLFGKLTYMPEQRDIDSLKHAEKMLGEASKSHTIYRAIISLDHETALDKGYYKRAHWQELVKNNVSIISKEMGIEHPKLCYMASMHYKKGHPHVHLVYWDSSEKVRREYMPKERFVIAMEKIRAGFGKEVFKEEIAETLAGKKENSAEARKALLAMMRELNPEGVLDIGRIKPPGVALIRPDFEALLTALRSDKNRRYAYLNKDSKFCMEAFNDKLFELPQFSALKRDYLKAADSLSSYYGNDEATKDFNRAKALEAFNKDVGNELLKFVKDNDVIDNFIVEHMPAREQISVQICDYIASSSKRSHIFAELKAAFPAERTPLREIVDEKFNAKLHMLSLDVLRNESISGRLSDFIKGSTVTAIKDGGFAEFCANADRPSEEANENGTLLKDFRKDTNSRLYGDFYKEVRADILHSLYEQSGYSESYKHDMMMNMFMTVFGEIGRGKSHMQNQRDCLHGKKNLTKTARKDLRERLKHSQDLEM